MRVRVILYREGLKVGWPACFASQLVPSRLVGFYFASQLLQFIVGLSASTPPINYFLIGWSAYFAKPTSFLL